jgi:putative membrane protein
MARNLFLLLLLAGCSTVGSDAAEPPRDDTTGRRDSTAAVAAASMREEHVIGLLAIDNAADSALGALAAYNGSTRDIKDFGYMVSREHMALRREALAMAKRLRLEPVAPPVPPDAPPAQMRAMVDSAPAGAPWDRAYLTLAIAAHESSLENLARALAATKSPEIKAYIERAAPIVEKHLEKARRMQQSTGPSRDAR